MFTAVDVIWRTDYIKTMHSIRATKNVRTWLRNFRVTDKCIFFNFLLSQNSRKRLGYKENNTKYRSVLWKPRNHFKILTYRTWRLSNYFVIRTTVKQMNKGLGILKLLWFVAMYCCSSLCPAIFRKCCYFSHKVLRVVPRSNDDVTFLGELLQNRTDVSFGRE